MEDRENFVVIDYKCQTYEVIDMVNEAIKHLGYKFVDDNKFHDSEIWYSLNKIQEDK